MIGVKTYGPLPYDKLEVLRYAGIPKAALLNGGEGEYAQVTELMESCIAEVDPQLTFRVCWKEFPICQTEKGLDLGFTVTASKSLQKNLENCDTVVLFAATTGLALDRMIFKYGRISPAKGHMMQALGAERIETLCDTFNEEVRREKEKEGRFLRPRYSPGYGDLPLEMQTDIFKALDCTRTIGLTLNDSLTMAPSKSVTAIIGVCKENRRSQ